MDIRVQGEACSSNIAQERGNFESLGNRLREFIEYKFDTLVSLQAVFAQDFTVYSHLSALELKDA